MVDDAKRGKLADILSATMTKRKISIQALASIVGVQRQTCYAWLHEYQQPKLDTLRRLSAILNIPFADLIAASYIDVEGKRLDSLLEVYLSLSDENRQLLEGIAAVIQLHNKSNADSNAQ